jgi:DNA-binding MarR family transcriptional regulator
MQAMARTRPMTLIALQRRTARLMIDELTERMHASGYSWAPARHYPVFENIDAAGTRLTVLASRAGITHQAMAQLVYELEEHNVVERVADPSDGRAKLVRLTDEGRERVDVALRHIAAIEDMWTQLWRRSGLADDPRAALERALHDVESTDRHSA